MTRVAAIPVYVIETENEIREAIVEKEKQLRKENENTRLFERMRIILNTPEVNKQLSESKKRAEKYEKELEALREKLN